MKMQQLLRKVVTEEKGTGASLRDLPVEVAGKSGTAQTNIEKGSSINGLLATSLIKIPNMRSLP